MYDHCSVGFIGGAIIATNSTIDISHSKFEDNEADFGGAIFAEQNSILCVSDSIFANNSAALYGGVLSSGNSYTPTAEVNDILYDNDAITDYKGIVQPFSSSISSHNIISSISQVLEPNSITITAVKASEFYGNNATYGGVFYSTRSTITIETSDFHDNSATSYGGVLASISTPITIGKSNFTKNHSPIGAVFHVADRSKVLYQNYLLINSNLANSDAVIYLSNSQFIGHDSRSNISFSNNLGSLVAFNSNVIFIGYALFVNNHQPPPTTTDNFQEGGAITVFQSNLVFDGACDLKYNSAENGGAIRSINSNFYINSNVSIAHNTATINGGGVYLSTTKLICQKYSKFKLFNNTAVNKGGELHASSSSINAISAFFYPRRYAGTKINITQNVAKFGGGLSLEANAKLNILKYESITN